MGEREEIDAAFALFGPPPTDNVIAERNARAQLAPLPAAAPQSAPRSADPVLAALDAVLATKQRVVAAAEAEIAASAEIAEIAPRGLVSGVDAVERLQLAREKDEENQPELWQEMPPLAYGPVVLDSDMVHVGGKRGFRARHDLPPGTLLMSEKPFLSWPRMTGDLPLHEATLTSLLHQDKDVRGAVLSHLALLHPVKLADVPVALVEQARREHGSWIQNIVDTLPEKDTITFDDVLRMLLVFQSNGFASGVYLHLSIFNHGCAANCIKYSPETETGPSEIRALRPIKAGEELIISYLDPVEMPTSARRQQLLGQFGFTCHCDWCEQSVELDADAAQAELDLHERLVKWKDKMNDGLAFGIVDELRAAADEREWSDLMQARLYRVMLDAYGMVVALRNEKTFASDVVHYLRAARRLFLLQERIWGPTAAPLAETAVDLCNGIQALLGFDRQVLFDAFPDVWPDFSAATKFEYKANQVHNWLRAIYKRRSTGIDLES